MTKAQTIIVHLICFITVFILIAGLLAYNLFHTAQNTRMSITDIITPATWRKIAQYRAGPSLECREGSVGSLPFTLLPSDQLIGKWLGHDRYVVGRRLDASTWQVLLLDSQGKIDRIINNAVTFPDSELTRSDTEIRSTLYLPDCSTLGCSIIVQPLEGSGSKQIVAFSSTDKEHASPEISGVIFDEARQLISYRTGSDLNSPRVVINTQNELIQTIDESPGDDRQLVLREYLPKAGLLRYHDPVAGLDYFYSLASIGLYRHRCSDGE